LVDGYGCVEGIFNEVVASVGFGFIKR
jgi:hypothetical protein